MPRDLVSLCAFIWQLHLRRRVLLSWRSDAPSRKRAASPKEGPRNKRATPAPLWEDLLEPQEDLAGPLEGSPNLQEGLSKPQEVSLQQPKDSVAPQEDSPSTTLIEHPVYFVSTVLRDAREKYPVQQKLLYALLIASRKLRHYFQGHPIKVVSTYPLEKISRNSNRSEERRVGKECRL